MKDEHLSTKTHRSQVKTILWLSIFSIAMGFMESAVVIYLREIYYPEGFQFPLVAMDANIGLVELIREAATIIMLAGIGILSAKTAILRFAYFLFCFAIWDLFYYIFLRLFLGWPESLFTWDILFLIPVPWVGPVIAPCLVSVTMIILAAGILHFHKSRSFSGLNLKEGLLIISGSIVIITSFIWDYLSYIFEIKSIDHVNTLSGEHNMFSEILDYVPAEFNWFLFLSGETIILSGIILYIIRMKKLA